MTQNVNITRQEIFERSLAFFLAPVKEYMEDDTVSEIMINGPGDIYVERAGIIEKTAATFPGEEALYSAVRNIAQYSGRVISDERPHLDARLPDGSRVHALMPPCARNGISISIRRFGKKRFGLKELIEFGALPEKIVATLKDAILKRRNVIISGGTGSGKTTLLNALSEMIPPNERVMVIEDNSELKIAPPHTVYAEGRGPDKRGRGGVTIRDLFVSSLRMRPDRIVIGEVRRGEALDLIQAMSSGHSGSLSTLHADTPEEALARLETMALMADIELPLAALRSQIAAAIHYVVQVNRLADGKRKVTRLSRVKGLDPNGNFRFEDIFKLEGAH